MILQALYEYAQRKGDKLPEDGFENIELKYLIRIKEDGSLVRIESTEEKIKQENGKEKTVWKTFNKVPKHVARTAAPKASLLIDNVGYVLGIPKIEKDEKKMKKAEEAAKIQNELFIKAIEDLPENVRQEKEISAVIKFYRDNKENGFDKIVLAENYEELKKCLGNVSFVLLGNIDIVAQNEKVREYQRQQTLLQLESSDDDSEKNISTCLITGEKAAISRLHSATAIRNSQATAPLVGFNNQAFESYGKKQSFNAPVSLKAESAYTKALKYLLKSDKNKILLGSDTVVFWAEKENPEYSLEDSFGSFFAYEDDPDKSVDEVKNLFDSIETGKVSKINSNFYVLGLSPNSGRISVRFWETGKVETFAERIKQHFDDFEIIKPVYDTKEYLTLFDILTSTALQHKMDNVAPNLIGNMVQSVLKGLPYPQTLQQQCIRRIRAEQKVTRERAAILKAYTNRINRINGKEEVTVSLNRECKDKGYLIGRLFAVLEKVQQDTHPNLNATITDRFYGAASTNPVTVFSQLLKLNQHHLANYENKGLKVTREKEIGEIMSMLESFPIHLDLNEQSMFAIGYYHEKESFFEKKETENSNEKN